MARREIQIRQVDAFTTVPFAGNYAGVVPDAAGLTETDMVNIAREMNVSETAFILPAGAAGADLRIRWFTPGEEVPLCGHATVASFHLLAEEGRWGMAQAGRYVFKLETLSGILNVAVDKTADGSTVEFELPVPQFRTLADQPHDILNSLGLQRESVEPSLPVVAEHYLYLPLRSLADMRRIQPSYSELARACEIHRVLGVSVFTLETIEATSAVHSRFFAPGLGVNEDPVTGSANGPLGVYLAAVAIPKGRRVASVRTPDGRTEFVGEQGDEVGRPGRVRIRVQHEGPTVRRVWIAGQAVTVLRGSIDTNILQDNP